MEELLSLDQVKEFAREPEFNFLYILKTNCSVCHALLPQVEEVLRQFPRIQAKKVYADKVPELAGRLSVFTVPVLILFLDAKEVLREARFVRLDEWKHHIEKMYDGYYS